MILSPRLREILHIQIVKALLQGRFILRLELNSNEVAGCLGVIDCTSCIFWVLETYKSISIAVVILIQRYLGTGDVTKVGESVMKECYVLIFLNATNKDVLVHKLALSSSEELGVVGEHSAFDHLFPIMKLWVSELLAYLLNLLLVLKLDDSCVEVTTQISLDLRGKINLYATLFFY